MAPNKPNGYYFYMQHQRQTRPGWARKTNAELSQICRHGTTRFHLEKYYKYLIARHIRDG
jgi:hypothetical protein